MTVSEDPPRVVLVVEDDPKISSVVQDYLRQAGYGVRAARDGAKALQAAASEPLALVILDVMLPGMDGFAVLRRLRTFSAAPVLMLTARVSESDRVQGLDIGADDYVVKPFSPRELLARAGALIRRAEGRFAATTPEASAYAVDLAGRRIAWAGAWLSLSPSEFAILAALMRQPGRTLSREQLLEHAGGGYRDVSDRAVDSHVKNIRRKIAAAEPGADPITSVYSVGYRFDPGPKTTPAPAAPRRP